MIQRTTLLYDRTLPGFPSSLGRAALPKINDSGNCNMSACNAIAHAALYKLCMRCIQYWTFLFCMMWQLLAANPRCTTTLYNLRTKACKRRVNTLVPNGWRGRSDTDLRHMQCFCCTLHARSKTIIFYKNKMKCRERGREGDRERMTKIYCNVCVCVCEV